MPRFTAVSREHHAGKKWRRFEGYAFAAKAPLAPIVGVELVRAALAMPLAFAQEAGRFLFVAVLSLTPGRNMFVAPDGRWLGGYLPAALRSYPFRLLPKQGSNEVILCFDTDSGLVVEDGSAGEDFFDKDGTVAPALKKLIDFLTDVERSRTATDLAVSALAQAGVIQPWQIKLKTEQGEQPISGLYHVDEAAFGALPDDAFLNLRKASALPIAYAQLLSSGQLGIFGQLARIQAQLAPRPATALPETLDSLFELPNDDMIKFR